MVNGQHINSEIVIKERPFVFHVHAITHWRHGMVLWVTGIILLLLATLGGKIWMIEHDGSPIVTYESIHRPQDMLNRAVYFSPDKVKPGETTYLHFDRVYWFTTEYRSELVFNITCLMEVERNGVKSIEPQRRDFPPYPISNPKGIGPVDPKHRPITVPTECLRGDLVHRAFARHDRGWPFSPRVTPMPEVRLQVTD